MDLAAVKAKCVDFLASPENANALVDILEFSEVSTSREAGAISR